MLNAEELVELRAQLESLIYNPRRFHNNVQCNLPCYADSALWVVPGSHVRPNTAAEDAAFGGSKHYAPPAAQMPGGVQMHIPAGQALLATWPRLSELGRQSAPLPGPARGAPLLYRSMVCKRTTFSREK